MSRRQGSGVRDQVSGVRGKGSDGREQGVAAIEMRGVAAGYRTHDVLSEVSLRVEQGQMAAIIGPSPTPNPCPNIQSFRNPVWLTYQNDQSFNAEFRRATNYGRTTESRRGNL